MGSNLKEVNVGIMRLCLNQGLSPPNDWPKDPKAGAMPANEGDIRRCSGSFKLILCFYFIFENMVLIVHYCMESHLRSTELMIELPWL